MEYLSFMMLLTVLWDRLTTFLPDETPCLRCFVPVPPPVTKTSVFGAISGTTGNIQLIEMIKYLT